MLVGFAVFCVLVYTGITTVSDILSKATEAQHAAFVKVEGQDVHIRRGQNGNQIKVEPTASGAKAPELSEGDVVEVGKDSRATVEGWDTSRIVIGENTQVEFVRFHTLRYFNQRERTIEVLVSLCRTCAMSKGSATISPAPGTDFKTNSVIAKTEYGSEIDLSTLATKGHSYSIVLEKINDVGEATFTSDNADNEPVVVRGQHKTQMLTHDRQVRVVQGKAPQEGRPIASQLIQNGAFLDPLGGTWDDVSSQGADQKNTPAGRRDIVTETTEEGGTYNILRFHRYGQEDFYESGIKQEINYTAPLVIKNINLSFDYKVVAQDPSGGGEQGYEFPLIVQIDYTVSDPRGKQNTLFNFYVEPPSTGRTFVLKDNYGYHSQKVSKDEWTQLRFDLRTLDPNLISIDRIKISAKGHNFDSYITNINLIATNGG